MREWRGKTRRGSEWVVSESRTHNGERVLQVTVQEPGLDHAWDLGVRRYPDHEVTQAYAQSLVDGTSL